MLLEFELKTLLQEMAKFLFGPGIIIILSIYYLYFGA